ncbi:MAG: transcriptional regulator [Deltaproteobacteria bacterium]|nr:MAG: transcriptional regulator [Deltaproteobacteria bacterium]
MKMTLLVTILLFSLPSFSGLPHIILSGDKGETLDGKEFDTKILKGKIFMLVHIDPDAANLNKHVDKALDAENFHHKYYGSVAIINAKATWMPNGVLRIALKNQRKKHPDTIYVLDYSKTFVNEWNFKDNSSSYMVINKKGIPIFRRDGKLTDEDVKILIKTIKDNLK